MALTKTILVFQVELPMLDDEPLDVSYEEKFVEDLTEEFLQLGIKEGLTHKVMNEIVANNQKNALASKFFMSRALRAKFPDLDDKVIQFVAKINLWRKYLMSRDPKNILLLSLILFTFF
jgi:hypothetical protein